MPRSAGDAPSTKSNRQRELNVIYFVDANKTRSLRIKIASAQFLVIAGAVAAVWTILASGLLFSSMRQVSQLESKLTHSMSVIFDYQVRFEEVYEKAYPNAPARDPNAKGEEAVVAAERRTPGTVIVKSVASDAGRPGDPVTVTQEAAKAPQVVQEPKAPIALAAKSAPGVAPLAGTSTVAAPPGRSIDIEEPKISQAGAEVKVRFALRNNQSPQKAEGFVFGIAKIENQAGRVFYLESPEGIQVDNLGQAKRPTAGFAYSIRYYKAKTMNFQLPPDTQGRVVEVSVGVLGNDGVTIVEKIPANLPIRSVATTAPTASIQRPDAPVAPQTAPPAAPQTDEAHDEPAIDSADSSASPDDIPQLNGGAPLTP